MPRKHQNNHQGHHGELEDDEESSGSRFFFGILFTISELFLFGSVVIFIYWIVVYDDGFAWQNNRSRQFNLHAILMVVGFIFLNGQAMLTYKLFNCCKKITTKIMHTILFVASISAISIGAVAGIQAQHNVPPGATPKHFYSIHSWVGLTAMGLFALQFVVGFVSFLVLLCCEKATAQYRARLLPTHRTFGLVIFSLATIATISGLLQTARYRLSGKPGKPDYKNILDEPSIVLNSVGVCIIGLAIVLPYIIRNHN